MVNICQPEKPIRRTFPTPRAYLCHLQEPQCSLLPAAGPTITNTSKGHHVWLVGLGCPSAEGKDKKKRVKMSKLTTVISVVIQREGSRLVSRCCAAYGFI